MTEYTEGESCVNIMKTDELKIYFDSLPKLAELDLLSKVEGNSLSEQESNRLKQLIEIRPIIAFDSEFSGLLREVRNAYVSGHYYCAMTGATAFGERILNKLIIDLREEYPLQKYPHIPEIVYKSKSNTNWEQMYNALFVWEVIDSELCDKFKELFEKRCRTIHYNPKLLDISEKEVAETINLTSNIIYDLFAMSKYFKLNNGKYILYKPQDYFFNKYYKN